MRRRSGLNHLRAMFFRYEVQLVYQSLAKQSQEWGILDDGFNVDSGPKVTKCHQDALPEYHFCSFPYGMHCEMSKH